MNIALDQTYITQAKSQNFAITDAMLGALRYCAETAINEHGTPASVCASALLSAQDEETLDNAFYVSDLGRISPQLCTRILDAFQLAAHGLKPADCILNGHTLLQLIAERHQLDTRAPFTSAILGYTSEITNDTRYDRSKCGHG